MKRRLSRFVTVSAIGFALQVGALALLTKAAAWPHAPATAAAVALAVLHNFYWHGRWTWSDRAGAEPDLAGRIARYFVVGATSIGGQLIFTSLGIELCGWSPVSANVAAVATCSFSNFLASDRWVFVSPAQAPTRGSATQLRFLRTEKPADLWPDRLIRFGEPGGKHPAKRGNAAKTARRAMLQFAARSRRHMRRCLHEAAGLGRARPQSQRGTGLLHLP